MNAIARLSIIALLSIAASGCVYINGERISKDDWRDEQRTNQEIISQLNLGTTRNTVIDKLGTPNDSEAFESNGTEYRVLFYRTRHQNSDGKTTRNESTPLIFKDDLLTGWGDAAYADLR